MKDTRASYKVIQDEAKRTKMATLTSKKILEVSDTEVLYAIRQAFPEYGVPEGAHTSGVELGWTEYGFSEANFKGVPFLTERAKENFPDETHKERFHRKIEERTDWEMMAWEVSVLIHRLRNKPKRIPFAVNAGGILNAYREGDLGFDEAKDAIRNLNTKDFRSAIVRFQITVLPLLAKHLADFNVPEPELKRLAEAIWQLLD